MEQRTLLNYDIIDPYRATTISEFRDQFRRLYARNPKAAELSRYYEMHPMELERRRSDTITKRDQK